MCALIGGLDAVAASGKSRRTIDNAWKSAKARRVQ